MIYSRSVLLEVAPNLLGDILHDVRVDVRFSGSFRTLYAKSADGLVLLAVFTYLELCELFMIQLRR